MEVKNSHTGVRVGQSSPPACGQEYRDTEISFPLTSLPEPLQAIANGLADRMGFPLDYIAASLLHACSSAIGATFESRFQGYHVSSNLFMVVVGDPGVNKSEPPVWAYKPIEDKDQQLFDAYRKQVAYFEAAKAMYRKGDDGAPPKEPVERKHIISDITLEALSSVSRDNPRGICLFVDELAGWFKNMNRYGNGSDQESWLSIFNGRGFNITRAGRASVRTKTSCIGVIGTIQPATLYVTGKDNRDTNGFLFRLLFVWPPNLKPVKWKTTIVDDSLKKKWHAFMSPLLDLEFDNDGEDFKPNMIPFSNEALEKIVNWQNEDIDRNKIYDDRTIDGISSKIHIYVVRFALIIHVMRFTCGDCNLTSIDVTSVEKAIELALYFKHQGIKVYNYMNHFSHIENLSKIKRELYEALPKTFTTAEILDWAQRINKKYPDDSLAPRTIEYWLANDQRAFNKVSKGKYEKAV